MVYAQTTRCWFSEIVDLNEYASIIMMLTKDLTFLAIGQNVMCGDYCLMNKWMHFNKYAMHLPNEIFDTFG